MKLGSRSAAGGFTLLEVLIAIVVFSIGLLGIAGLQVAGMRFTYSSQLRAIATAQADSLADRMRGNPIGMVEGFYNITDGTPMPTALDADCSAETCTPEQLATYDLVTWNAGLDDASKPRESNGEVLPDGDGVVCIDSEPDDGGPADWACDNLGEVYAIKVVWTERASGGDDLVDTDGDGEPDAVGDIATRRLVMRVIPYADVP